MRTPVFAAAVFMAVLLSFSVCRAGEDLESRLDRLDAEVSRQSETIREQQKTIESLKAELASRQEQPLPQQGQPPQPLPAETPAAAGASGFFGGAALTNPNISLVVDTFALASSLNDDERESQGIPGFTTSGLEQRNGFNLRAAELFFFAPVDPFFNLYVTLPVTEDGIELEEAYAVTTALPEGFQAKGGKFKSNFSRLDAQHPHAWDFYDIALPYRAFLGDEGLGGEKGVQLTWLPAWPVYTQFGAEVLQGENDLLFGAEAADGPHAFSLFVKSSIDTTDDSTLYFGPSVLFGQARSASIVADSGLDGDSAFYGLEGVWKWKPRPRQALTLQSEYLYLAQDGDLTAAETAEPLGSLRRRQDGFYVQGVYQLDRWQYGLRYDLLEPFADSFEQDGVGQDLGKTPWRATATIGFNPSDFTRIRLQYNHEEGGPDGQSNDEAILQFLFGIGAHAAHAF